MRNLKRALSLALATVMTLGLMVVGTGAAAAGYDDVSSEDNVEAIEVLQTVGIMTGDENGNFNPDANVTRNEMAVIMSQLLNLNYDYYRGTNPFTDVPSWAAPYVAACAAEGVVAGIGDGLYGGDNNVTAAQAALMIMKALGYFQYQNDFGGDWQVATIRQASYIRLFDGIEASAETALTRNQIAQLVLNGLKANMVEFTGDVGDQITIGDTTINSGYRAEYTARTNAANQYNTIDVGTTNIAENDQYYIQLGEELYDGDLELRDSTDVFGRPAREWSFDGDEIGTYVKNELLREEYTDEVTGRTLYDLLGSTTINNYDFYIYVDGVEAVEENETILADAYFTEGNLVRSNTNAVGETGRGVLTQVYVDSSAGNNGEVTIAIINTYLAEATSDYDDRDDELDLDIYAIEDKGSRNNVVFVKNSGDNSSGDPYTEDVTVSGEDFAIESYVDGDQFLVTVADGEVQTLAEPEILDAVTIDSFRVNRYVESEGTQYDYADTLVYDPEVLDVYTGGGTTNLKDLTYNLILDPYGYLIGVEQNEDANQYLFLTGMDGNTSDLGARNADANVIFLDGTMDTVEVNVRDSVGLGTLGANMELWCTYSVNNAGVYTLEVVDSDAAFDYDTDKAGQARYYNGNTTTADEDWLTIDTQHPALSGVNRDDNGSTPTVNSGNFAWVYGNDDSIYITVEVEDTAVTSGTRGIITDVDSVVTGIDNANLNVYNYKYVMDEVVNGAGSTAQGVYTLFDDDGYVIAAIVVGEDAGSTSDYAFVTSSDVNRESYNSGTDEWTWTREVIVNGELTEITYVDDALNVIGQNNGADRMLQGHWYEVKYYADGTVKSAEELDTPVTAYPTPGHDLRSDEYYSNVSAAIDAVADGEDTVLLDTTTGVGDLTLRASTLYTDTSNTEGVYVSGDVKVVRLQDVDNVKYDEIEEYDGVSGLEDAIDDIDSSAARLVAIIENGRATSIILIDDGATTDEGDSNTDGRYDVVATDGNQITISGVADKITLSNTKVIDTTISGSNKNAAYGTVDVQILIEVRDGGWVEELSFDTQKTGTGADVNAQCILSGDFDLPNGYTLQPGTYRATITISNDLIGEHVLGPQTFTVR